MSKLPERMRRERDASAIAHVELLSVLIDIEGQTRPVGTLAWSRGERRAYFEYDGEFLKDPLPLSPFRLAVAPGLQSAPHAPFGGLQGLFNDSLPDGWGRRLLDRRIRDMGGDHLSLTPLDRLAYVGRSGMGALSFVPEKLFDGPSVGGIDLDLIAEQVDLVQRGEEAAEVNLLQAAQGASGGVRPKLMIGLAVGSERVIADVGRGLPAGFKHWIVKFPSTDDSPAIGTEEFAYSLMARAAGIDVPESRLIKTERGLLYFAVRRFDRIGGRQHVQTASGLLEADHRTPSIDYETLLRAAGVLTKNRAAVQEMFRRMVFNVLAHNRDDHAKNHSFRMDAEGNWSPTPAYDLTFSLGPGGQHNLDIDGEGRAPGPRHILAVGADARIARADAEAVLEQVRAAVGRWSEFATAAGVPDRRIAEIDAVLNRDDPGAKAGRRVPPPRGR